MSKKRGIGTLPQPPWSYSLSEVAAWMASTAGPKSRRDARSRRQIRVKRFVGRCPASTEGKLVRRLAGLGFETIEGALHSSPGRNRFVGKTGPETFLGKLGDTRVQIRLRRGAALELRVTFTPRISFRRASKLISRIGLRGLEGTWT